MPLELLFGIMFLVLVLEMLSGSALGAPGFDFGSILKGFEEGLWRGFGIPNWFSLCDFTNRLQSHMGRGVWLTLGGEHKI